MRSWFACLMLMAATSSCKTQGAEWAQSREMTTVTFLVDEVDRALSHLAAARPGAGSDTLSQQEHLASVQTSLEHLKHYYLPLLQARETARQAFAHFSLGRTAATIRELRDARAILMRIAAENGPTVRAEMERLVDQATDAEDAISMDTGRARTSLRELLTRLNLLALKGDMILNADPAGPDRFDDVSAK